MAVTITSAAQFYKAANGQLVRKTCEGVATVEQWPAMAASIKAQLIEQGANPSDIEETDNGIAIGAQIWRKPAMIACETGKLTVRSKDYAFLPACGRTNGKPIYGDKAGAVIEGGKLVKRYAFGLIVTIEILGEGA